MELIFAFLTVSFFTVASPGPSTLFVVRQAASGGFAVGMAGVSGILASDAIFLLAGSLGLGAVINAAPWVLLVLKVAGAGYFAYLAWAMCSPYVAPAAQAALRAAGIFLPQQTLMVAADAPAMVLRNADSPTVLGTLRAALLMHLANPKALLFFTLLIPLFIRADLPLPGQVSLLLGLHLAMALGVLTLYAGLGAAFKRTALGSQLTMPLDLICAAVMLSLSVGILATV